MFTSEFFAGVGFLFIAACQFIFRKRIVAGQLKMEKWQAKLGGRREYSEAEWMGIVQILTFISAMVGLFLLIYSLVN